MSYSHLLMWFEAPLQSWGHDSKFGRRDTLNFPTKSGVYGLLCCALGAGGDQRELLERLAPMPLSVISFARAKNQFQAQEKIKCDREPLLRDFHMVGSGYDDQDPWQNLLIPKTSDGKKAVGGGTKMTYRYYLQDAAFAAVLQLPSDEINIFVEALKNPVWDLYFGRKNCVPTDFIYRGIFSDEAAAFEYASQIASEKNLLEDFRVLEGEHEGEILILNDVPIQFGEHKQYRDRFVTIYSL